MGRGGVWGVGWGVMDVIGWDAGRYLHYSMCGNEVWWTEQGNEVWWTEQGNAVWWTEQGRLCCAMLCSDVLCCARMCSDEIG